MAEALEEGITMQEFLNKAVEPADLPDIADGITREQFSAVEAEKPFPLKVKVVVTERDAGTFNFGQWVYIRNRCQEGLLTVLTAVKLLESVGPAEAWQHLGLVPTKDLRQIFVSAADTEDPEELWDALGLDSRVAPGHSKEAFLSRVDAHGAKEAWKRTEFTPLTENQALLKKQVMGYTAFRQELQCVHGVKDLTCGVIAVNLQADYLAKLVELTTVQEYLRAVNQALEAADTDDERKEASTKAKELEKEEGTLSAQLEGLRREYHQRMPRRQKEEQAVAVEHILAVLRNECSFKMAFFVSRVLEGAYTRHVTVLSDVAPFMARRTVLKDVDKMIPAMQETPFKLLYVPARTCTALEDPSVRVGAGGCADDFVDTRDLLGAPYSVVDSDVTPILPPLPRRYTVDAERDQAYYDTIDGDGMTYRSSSYLAAAAVYSLSAIANQRINFSQSLIGSVSSGALVVDVSVHPDSLQPVASFSYGSTYARNLARYAALYRSSKIVEPALGAMVAEAGELDPETREGRMKRRLEQIHKSVPTDTAFYEYRLRQNKLAMSILHGGSETGNPLLPPILVRFQDLAPAPPMHFYMSCEDIEASDPYEAAVELGRLATELDAKLCVTDPDEH